MRASGVRRIAVGVVGAVLLLGASAPAAGAAVTIGDVDAAGGSSCSGATGMVQETPAAGKTYVAPSDGVITSFSFYGDGGGKGGGNTQTKLLVLDPLGSGSYHVAAVSQTETVVADFLVTRVTRLAISAGQTVGTWGYSCKAASGGTIRDVGAPEPVVGSTRTFGSPTPGRMLLEATIEPDEDSDGFGDETQDACPADASLQEAPCDRAPPDASITKQPKDKTKRRKATFEFTSSEPGSSFECILDGEQQFKPCTSPLTVKVKKGKHTFSVTAIDATGNADPTPATDDWKVKKKKK